MVVFINDYDDEPYFGKKQIADIYKVSGSIDAAILKLRNPSNKLLDSIDISKSNVSNVKLGDKVIAYGYPAKFGTKVKYTSGDFSGTEGNFIETTAVIDSGNSGGGAYLESGMFIGIPTAVQSGKYTRAMPHDRSLLTRPKYYMILKNSVPRWGIAHGQTGAY